MLLSVDYKILAKAIDNHLKLVLPDLINKDQSGFVKGRSIVHNVRTSLNIIEYTKQNKIPGLILTIDMEKCFDRLDHGAILKSLSYFNFGTNFVCWIQLFYNKFQVETQSFGVLSNFFDKTDKALIRLPNLSWIIPIKCWNTGKQITKQPQDKRN